MDFYTQCQTLRNHYFRTEANPLKLRVLSKLVSFVFYNEQSSFNEFDHFPRNKTILLNCYDLSHYSVYQLTTCLVDITNDLGVPVVNMTSDGYAINITIN